MVEPWLEYLPKNKRVRGYISWLLFPFVFIAMFPIEYARYLLVHGPSVPDLLLPMLIPGAMVGANQLGLVAPPDVLETLKVWLYTVVSLPNYIQKKVTLNTSFIKTFFFEAIICKFLSMQHRSTT